MPGGYPRQKRLDRPQLQCQRPDARRHQVGRAGPDAGKSCPRSCGAPSRGCAPGAAGRCWSRCRRTSGTRRRSLVRYVPSRVLRTGPDPDAIREAAKMLLAAKRPVLYAGQGVHWAKAWGELKQLAELLAIPVCTILQGKSAFPETHPLALGSGGLAYPATVHHFLKEADLILGIGCSFTTTNFGVTMPAGKTIIHDDARCDRREQGRRLRARRARRRQAHARGADRGSLAHAEIAARSVGRREGDQGHLRSLARQMDAEAHPQRGAVLALSRAVGPAEHRRHRQHHHHA